MVNTEYTFSKYSDQVNQRTMRRQFCSNARWSKYPKASLSMMFNIFDTSEWHTIKKIEIYSSFMVKTKWQTWWWKQESKGENRKGK